MSTFRERLHRFPLALEAFAWLTLAWLTLDVLPGRLYRRLLPSATATDVDSTAGEEAVAPCDARTARIAWAVERVGNAMPFRCVCFHRGIAAHRMLRRRGIPSTLHYGVAHTAQGRTLRAHVWVSSNGRDVVGGSVKQEFQEIANFPFGAVRGFTPGVKS